MPPVAPSFEASMVRDGQTSAGMQRQRRPTCSVRCRNRTSSAFVNCLALQPHDFARETTCQALGLPLDDGVRTKLSSCEHSIEHTQALRRPSKRFSRTAASASSSAVVFIRPATCVTSSSCCSIANVNILGVFCTIEGSPA